MIGRKSRIALAVAASLVLAAAAAALLGQARYARSGPTDRTVTVIIPKGSGLAGITHVLGDHGLIVGAIDPWVFQVAVKVGGRGGALKAGEYEFPAGIGIKGIIDILVGGMGVVRRLTIAEGLTSVEVAALIKDAEGLEGGDDAVPAEGTLLPETYHYTWGDRRGEVIARMRHAMTQAMEALWRSRGPHAPATAHEALVLASIVEKETGVPAERPRIAAVFLNRLRLGMKLQSDPTVIYGLTQDGGFDRGLTRAELTQPTPYNTYVVDGLPPGPICNPGKAAIAAVLHPADTRDLYFVADGSGGHAFAPSLAEHNRNVTHWRKLERQRAGHGEGK